MTPAKLLEELASVMVGGGFQEAVGHLGVVTEGSKTIDRSFAILPSPSLTGWIAGRGRPDAGGMLWEESFTIEIAHVLKPKAGRATYTQALKDQHTVLHLLSAHFHVAYSLGTPSREIVAGGQYMVTRIEVRPRIQLSLSVPPP